MRPPRPNPFPWSRRTQIWDPPTLLDSVLDSPLRTLIQFLYAIFLALRGAPFKPPRNKPKIKVVCLSDTHSHVVPVPNGDVLIHAGDMTNDGRAESIQKQIDWLASLPHREKIIIAGNHDEYFDTKKRHPEDNGRKLNFRSLHYLENKSVTLKFKGGRKLNFYGAPAVPKTGEMDDTNAFLYERERAPWQNRIPLETDVLITHTPPQYHLDNGDLGCAGLLEEIWLVKPRLHVFGHIHSGHGREAIFWDKGQSAFERLMASKRGGILGDLLPSMAWVDAIKVVWHGVKGILWQRLMVGPAGGNGSMMINPAIVYQSTLEVGNLPEVVEL